MIVTITIMMIIIIATPGIYCFTKKHISYVCLQVPQFLLEDAILSGNGSSCSVIVTQPRRIAAISVAERVAAERGDIGKTNSE